MQKQKMDKEQQRFLAILRKKCQQTNEMVSRQGMVAPPQKNQSDSKESSHCVVDQIPNLNVFVIFYKRHFYPEYLVTFSG
ncbi:hypothetical protein pdam_00011089 [Pocillopora damicornis]|uniref:Uncharacterized protein n=1 Tax=Pocillopora damicornis TaxID=46731 RepID=A0A3M6U3T5_POCDA|nr:hypothetical protein pdam_00011089 [Pocillopora damicornis]